MRQLKAFTKKEIMETARTGKLLFLFLLFILFGIMNPAIAKLTPWLMETMSESLAESGFAVASVEVTALSSWSQFYKNIPLCTIVFVLLFSTILTAEYQKRTLVNLLTKGMKRWKVLISKTFALAAFWTCGYWLCYGITYGYNAYFWDNSIVYYAGFSAFCFYLLGLWILSLVMLLSVLLPSGSLVLLGLFGGFCITWLARLLPYVKEWTPARLLSASQLLTGGGSPGDYGACIFFTWFLILFHIGAAILRFTKKAI